MLQPAQMDSDLVRPSALDFDIKERKSFVSCAHAVEREGLTPAAHNRHARAIARVARDGLLYAPCVFRDAPVNKSNIGFEDFARAKLVCQLLVRLFILGDKDETRSVFVQTMHDAGTHSASALREFLEMK